MNLDSVKKLRLDRRLLGRRGWLSERERNEALDSLPDTAAKATTLGAVADASQPQESASSADG